MSDYTPDDFDQLPEESNASSSSEYDANEHSLDWESNANHQRYADDSQYDSYDESGGRGDQDNWSGVSSHSVEDYQANSQSVVLEDLSLWEVLGLLFFRPIRVGRQLFRIILNADVEQESTPTDEYDHTETVEEADFLASGGLPRQRFPQRHPTVEFQLDKLPNQQLWQIVINRLGLDRHQASVLGLLAMAMIFAFIGSGMLWESALDPLKKAENDLGGSGFWFFLSAFTYVLAIMTQYFDWRVQERRNAVSFTKENRSQSDDVAPEEEAEALIPLMTRKFGHEGEVIAESDRIQAFFAWFERHSMRFALIPVALILSWLAYDRNVAVNPDGAVSGIVFTRGGFMSWVLAIFCWYLIFVVDINGLFVRIVRERQSIQEALGWQIPQFQWRWAYVGLIGIMVLAAYFRMDNLEGIPPQMTSDHIEKLINAVDVENGVYTVFFANNGGREAFQMYAIASIADWGGVGFNFKALKYATIIEGLLTVFLSFWVAKEIIGRDTEERRRLGNWVGLSMAALLAISSWHTMLSRLGLRIVLTPLTVLIVTYFLVRTVRYNRRSDFVNMGLMLGFGTYFYQANRMLPILVVITVGIVALFRARGNVDVVWRYGTNLLFAGIIALVIYLPMHRYSQEFPREFWNRTYGRVFGERTFDCVNPQTNQLDFCQPSFPEMYELLQERRYGPLCEERFYGEEPCETGFARIQTNYKNALISYMWEGDGQWITNGGGYPALDSRTNALYMLGLLMLVVMMVRRRDIAFIIIPLGILIMVLPSALAIAATLNENPSFTRTSGTIPFVYFVAALPLGTLAYQIVKAGYSRTVYYSVAVLVVALIINNAAKPNYDAYFSVYRQGYEQSWKPYDQIAAPVKSFAEGPGSFGNAFMVGYPHWLDHRIVGQMAGDLNWANNLNTVEEVYAKILANQGTPYEYNPEKPILFMVNLLDTDTLTFLEQNFPGGQTREVYADRNNNYYLYEAPPGWAWLAARVTTQTSRLSCIINCEPGPQ